MKTSHVLIGIVILIVVGGLFVFLGSSTASQSSSNPGSSTSSTQKVVLSIKNGNYYPNTITVKSGQPVELSLDNSVGGCFRSFTINQLGVKKYMPTPSDSVTFTPTEKGTYRFACSMGMGYGTLIVE